MKNLYYYENRVTAYEDAFEGESIGLGAGVSVFVGSHGQCKQKVRELALDYGDFDLSLPEVPPCSPRQIRLWLLGLGVTNEMILAQINSIPDLSIRAMTLIEYEYASVFERNHPFVDTIGFAIGLNSEQIDQGFTYASTI
jgi:hypothetical protein